MNNINDVMNNININELDSFFANTDSNFMAVTDIKETKIDYNWLNILEDTLPSLDKIIRNPRRFIVNEEEVVIVEKTKKITQETIRHLAQHSENIQDVKENGEVMPKRLLNVYKEETSDLYENRFIYTLIKRLEHIINMHLDKMEIISSKEINRKVNYNAKTIINNRQIKIDLKMEEYANYTFDDETYILKERIMSCYEVVKLLKNSGMMKDLIGCTLITGKVRRTNLILRDPDFQKAYILWEYLNQFEFKDPKVVNYDKTVDTSKETRDEFTLGYYIESNALEENHENLMQYKDFDAKLNKIINEYIYEESNSIIDFEKKAKEFYKNALEEKDKRINNLTKIYNEFINNHNNILSEL